MPINLRYSLHNLAIQKHIHPEMITGVINVLAREILELQKRNTLTNSLLHQVEATADAELCKYKDEVSIETNALFSEHKRITEYLDTVQERINTLYSRIVTLEQKPKRKTLKQWYKEYLHKYTPKGIYNTITNNAYNKGFQDGIQQVIDDYDQ